MFSYYVMLFDTTQAPQHFLFPKQMGIALICCREVHLGCLGFLRFE